MPQQTSSPVAEKKSMLITRKQLTKIKKPNQQLSMPLKLPLHYHLCQKTCIPHVAFFKLCIIDNTLLFAGQANKTKKKWHYKKGRSCFKEIPCVYNVSDCFVDFFSADPHLLTLTMILPAGMHSESLLGF